MTPPRTISLTICLCMLSLLSFSQNVTILPGGITPALSGSYPRLSHDELVALPSPLKGDIAYDATFNCLRLYNGHKWVRLLSDQDLNMPAIIGWSAGGASADEGYSIATDTLGNLYITGYFQGTATFDTTHVVSAGSSDVFIVKYTNDGLFQWVKTAGGSGEDIGHDISVDNSGNIYLTGMFHATADFSGTTLTSAGLRDIFTAKYSTNGTLQWVREGGGSNAETSLDIVLDNSGNIYITGYFYGTTIFDGNSITSAGAEDIFFIKYNTSGTLQWVQKLGGVGTDVGLSILVDNSGYVYIAGYFSNTVAMGIATITSAGGSDAIVAKYNPITSGWVGIQIGGGSSGDGAMCLALDASGNIYCTGYFAATANFGGTTLTSAGNIDIYVVKYDTSFNLLWIKGAGGIAEDAGLDLEMDISGNVYITGFINTSAAFGNTIINSEGSRDIFVAKYNNAGVLQWVQRMGGAGFDTGTDLIIDKNKNLYLTGTFQYEIIFGNTMLSGPGGLDAFVARIKE